jgi:cytochrome P450
MASGNEAATNVTVAEAAAHLAQDFDHHSETFKQNIPELYGPLREKCPVPHGENHGGVSVLLRYQDVKETARDHKRFSSENDVDGTGNGGEGFMVPGSAVQVGFLEMDPPDALKYRRIITDWMSASAVEAFEPRMRELIVEEIERVLPMGEFDVVSDLGNPIPAKVTMEFMGFPLEEWELFSYPIHEQTYIVQGSPEFVPVAEAIGKAQERAFQLVAERRENPTGDLFSRLLAAEIDGEPISDQMIVGIAWLLMGGGFDTSTGVFAYVMRYLSENPDQRRRLIEEPDLIPVAAEEFIRYFSPSTTMARTVVEPVVVSDRQFEPGDHLLLCWAAANRDPEVFEDPDELIIDRSPNPHIAFGDGVHKCVGAKFARTELRIFLEELLTRMPNFEVESGEGVLWPSLGLVNGFSQMPAVIDPGK